MNGSKMSDEEMAERLAGIVRSAPLRNLLVRLYRAAGTTHADPTDIARLARHGLVTQGDGVQLTEEGRVIAYHLHEWNIQVEQKGIFPFLAGLGLDGDSVVADLGCGGGQTLLACRQIAPCRIIGFDRDRTALRLARAWMRAAGIPAGAYSFDVADIHRIPLPPSSCTHVICRVVLQKLSIPVALREIARILRPKGRLFLHALGPGYYLDVGRRGARDLCISSFALANGLVYLACGSQICVRWRGKTLREAFLMPGRTERMLRGLGMRVIETRITRFGGIPSTLVLIAEKRFNERKTE